MRNRRKVISLMLAALMLTLAFSACSSGSGAASSTAGTTATATATATATGSTTVTQAMNTAVTELTEYGFPKGEWKIALSNSYIGNAWRSQMVNTFTAYAENLKEAGVISDYYASSSGQDPEAQINEIRNMMSEGYDAIIVDAASSTALIPICEEAIERGIVIATFDCYVECPDAYLVTGDQVEAGRKQAQWIVDQIGGKGNILWVRGTEGTSITNDRVKGATEVLQPYIDKGDIVVLATDYGQWSEAQVSVVINNMLAAYGDQGIDAILNEGQGEVAIYNALKEFGYDPTTMPYTGEVMNCVARLILQEGCNIYGQTSPPSHVAECLNVCVKVLNGEEAQKTTVAPMPEMTKDNAKDLYFEGYSDSLITAYTDEGNTYNLTIDDVLPDTK